MVGLKGENRKNFLETLIANINVANVLRRLSFAKINVQPSKFSIISFGTIIAEDKIKNR